MKNLIYISLVIIVFGSCSCRKVEIDEDKLKTDQYYHDGDYNPFTGICITEYHDSGKIKASRSLKDGIMNGETIVYYKNGSVRRQGKYVDGKYEGLWEGWYENGEKEFEIEHHKGMLHGEYILYHSNGKPREKGRYHKNKPTGHWKTFDEKGSLIEEREY